MRRIGLAIGTQLVAAGLDALEVNSPPSRETVDHLRVARHGEFPELTAPRHFRASYQRPVNRRFLTSNVTRVPLRLGGEITRERGKHVVNGNARAEGDEVVVIRVMFVAMTAVRVGLSYNQPLANALHREVGQYRTTAKLSSTGRDAKAFPHITQAAARNTWLRPGPLRELAREYRFSRRGGGEPDRPRYPPLNLSLPTLS